MRTNGSTLYIKRVFTGVVGGKGGNDAEQIGERQRRWGGEEERVIIAKV